MDIGAVGYNYEHREKFVMDRPEGTGCFLLLIIKQPSVFEINGAAQNVAANSFVLFSPETPYRYYAAGDVYTDDWLYMNLDAAERERLAQLGIPCDTVLPLVNAEELSQLVRTIAYEFYSTDRYNAEILRHYAEILLLKLSRDIAMLSLARSKSGSDRYNTIFYLRNKIYAAPDEIPDVNGLAQLAGMSRSGFQHMYKRLFGVSVISDIIESRLNRAKRLLRSTDLGISDIALKCGYSNEYSFMRQFKERLGVTPTQYRSRI